MKILLREHGDEQYVWVTAKYDGNKFIVDGRRIYEYQIVSIINDNRKNYVRCSSCGKIFPKKGKKFAKHQELASTVEPCLTCKRLRTTEFSTKRKYVINDNGTYTRKEETIVDLVCGQGLWEHYACHSPKAIASCKLRQCGSAKGEEIHDTFIDYPGLFDDIITVDKILDNGHGGINWSDNYMTEYILNGDIGLYAHVNRLSIIDRFLINRHDYCGYIWYSKKYDLIFGEVGDGYGIWEPKGIDEEAKAKIEAHIRNIYK